jgi:hypothetical protein
MSHGMRTCKPLHVARNASFDGALNQQMPVVWHHAVTQQTNRMPAPGLGQHFEERLKVVAIPKDRLSIHRALHEMRGGIRWKEPPAARHDFACALRTKYSKREAGLGGFSTARSFR